MPVERPAVSVLMLCFNEAVFIRRAVRSVLAQTYSGQIEIVLVDDGSSDGSAGILREELRLAARDTVTLKVITNAAPTGNADAFVAGLEAARGRFYHVLDCDDYWIDPDKLLMQVNLLEARPELAGVAHRTIVRNQIDRTESFHPEQEPAKNILTFEDLAVDGIYFHTSAMLYRNDFYQPQTDSVSVPDIFHEVRGDTIRLYVHATRGPILYVAQSMSVYDDHGGGIWTSLDWPGKQALLRNLYDRMAKRGYLAGMGDARATSYLTQRLTEIAAYTPTTLRPVSLYPAQVSVSPRYRLTNISHIGSLRDMEIQMDTLVQESHYEDALQLLQRLLTAVAYDRNLARTGTHRRIASFEVDWQCARLGEMIGAKYNVLPQAPAGDDEGPVVFVVSGVVDDQEGLWQETRDILALYQGRRPIKIMSTELLPSSPALCDMLREEGIEVMCNNDTLSEAKVAWVMWHLARQGPSQVFVNPARNDVALLAGLRREHASRIHLLTALGTGFALGRLSQVIDGFVARRPYDLAYYAKIAPGREIAHVPSYPRKGRIEPLAPLSTDPLVSVTVCTDPRNIEQIYDYSFDRAIPAVLESGVARHIHVGELSDATINRIRKALALKGLPPEAFEVHPHPDDLATFLRDCGASVFLQVFPVPEHRPMQAALAAGLPTVLHYGYLHPMLALDDMCYPGAPIWGTIGELCAILRGIDDAWLADQRAGIEAHLARFGSAEAVLNDLGEGLMAAVPQDRIPEIAVPETHHELRRLLTELMGRTVFKS
ncbi:glycosyltransferase family 2 protein [Sulfitobacter sabulilitoris]|uniref:Glycosyltransferase family 2 protein n=1 Tax=Sulfitobacter sabulilitoris TaxID=2562655 RepID=A0A5S3P7J6_9RHOB|nr:glycosyltransferase family A protein [Sulfitobacter sabulilitoris]TMM49361.1 glycosyltransferase family 2 protein [Sulfitobacter sabulilitoris]